VRGKSGDVRTLFESASHKTTYPFKSPKHGQLEVGTVVVKMNQVRARATSRDPVMRLLLVGLAFVISNLYIANGQHVAISLNHPAKPVSRY
jgi:hypothetical protein